MKSHDQSDYLKMFDRLYSDAVERCLAEFSILDLDYVHSRVEEEGLSFLTITLPQFAKDFERSLANQYVDPTHFYGFRKCGAIPAFLQGMLGRIFDRETGRIFNEDRSHPILVESVRQVCLFFKKMVNPCSSERNAKAISNFVEIEHANSVFQLSDRDAERFRSVSRLLWRDFFDGFTIEDLKPKHGPGATAERISGNQKYSWRFWNERLEPYFPFFGSAVSVSAADGVGFDLDSVTFLKESEEIPVRVILVPKTLKAPRVIAAEPVCTQYAQQALQSDLRSRLETYWLTRGHVNFTSQKVNQRMAVDASITGQLATIDLSDASDRVLATLVSEMFSVHLDYHDALFACRSTHAELPDGRVIGPLKKFASMGSATCFPVESMYFYTICVVALLEHRQLSLTRRNIFDVTRDVYVYGDDIIVPTDAASVVLDHLHKYNCKVNSGKTFVSGNFRESCGVDAFRGYQVQPVYLRRSLPKNQQQAHELVSTVATARQLDHKGFWRCASFLYKQVERIIGRLPYVSDTSPALGRVPLYPGHLTVTRRRRGRPFPEIRGWVVDTVYRSDQIDGYSALYKSLLGLEFKPRGSVVSEIVDRDDRHLEQTALRGAVTLKRRWVPAT